jgi:hypothetical protein
MHCGYSNSLRTYCHDFAGTDEIIFMIALCALAKVTEHPVRVSEVSIAISLSAIMDDPCTAGSTAP